MSLDLQNPLFAARIARALGSKGRIPLGLDETAVPMIGLVDLDAAPYLTDARYFIDVFTQPAIAGQVGSVGWEFWTDGGAVPVTNAGNAVAIIDALDVYSTTAQRMFATRVGEGARPAGFNARNAQVWLRDRKIPLGGTPLLAPFTRIQYGVTSAAITGFFAWDDPRAVATTAARIGGPSRDLPGIMLFPGESILIYGTTVNTPLSVNISGRFYQLADGT